MNPLSKEETSRPLLPCPKGKLPLLPSEAFQQMHFFLFALAVVYFSFHATNMFLASARISLWKKWEDSIHQGTTISQDNEFKERAEGFWKNAAVVAWMVAFAKQFHGSITETDYIYLRQAFIKKHCRGQPNFNFYDHIIKTYRHDFQEAIGSSWYIWMFVVLFLLLNLEGWHAYFWLSFLPLIMLFLMGAKLEYIITRMAQELDSRVEDKEAQQEQVHDNINRFHRQHKEIKKHGSHHVVNPSDELFWFARPSFVLVLIRFILFQNSFQIAFLFWIWTTYGFKSCIMEKPAFNITTLILGAIVQVLCSHSTLPLYSLVTQMGSEYKKPTEGDQMSAGQDHKVQERSTKEPQS